MYEVGKDKDNRCGGGGTKRGNEEGSVEDELG